MIPKSTHHLEKVISELRVDKAYLEHRLAELEKERDETITLLKKVNTAFYNSTAKETILHGEIRKKISELNNK